MKTATLSRDEARVLALHAQGLNREAPFGRGHAGVLGTLRALGYVQLDTIAVMERAHHHVLWTRVDDYDAGMLDACIAARTALEYWSHAAAVLPMEHYPHCRVRMERVAKDGHWFDVDPKMTRAVLARVKKEGPLQARDFEDDTPREGWFDWKPAKRALEQLYMQGTLLVGKREGFQKVYDLAERVLPEGVGRKTPSVREHAEFLVEGALRAHGVVGAKGMAYQRKGMLEPVHKVVAGMVARGELVAVKVEGVDEELYARAAELEGVGGLKGFDEARPVRLLSPFDNLVIQRERVRGLFGFEYQIECYTPEAKRKFGYFCLPLLYRGKLVARADVKADRVKKVFRVKRLAMEPGAVGKRESVRFGRELDAELARLAAFNGCARAVVEARG